MSHRTHCILIIEILCFGNEQKKKITSLFPIINITKACLENVVSVGGVWTRAHTDGFVLG